LRFDAASADCVVLAFREGLLAAVGHDVTLRVSDFTVDVGADDTIEARFAAASLRVTSPSSPADARDIERRAARDVLDAARFPSVVFRSSQVSRSGGTAQVAGTLTLHGVTRSIAFAAVDDGARWHAEVPLDQRQFGIRPYVALLGALRVRPEVIVRLSVPRW
jgi:polyisoprenoid-binding protein YceI